MVMLNNDIMIMLKMVVYNVIISRLLFLNVVFGFNVIYKDIYIRGLYIIIFKLL